MRIPFRFQNLKRPRRCKLMFLSLRYRSIKDFFAIGNIFSHIRGWRKIILFWNSSLGRGREKQLEKSVVGRRFPWRNLFAVIVVHVMLRSSILLFWSLLPRFYPFLTSPPPLHTLLLPYHSRLGLPWKQRCYVKKKTVLFTLTGVNVIMVDWNSRYRTE